MGYYKFFVFTVGTLAAKLSVRPIRAQNSQQNRMASVGVVLKFSWLKPGQHAKQVFALGKTEKSQVILF